MSTEPARKPEPKQDNPWAKYEQRKAELPKDLSPEQYQAECKRIAEELGI
jgi:hypothetical protein